ncbi:MAG TPA: hypothetical protein VGP06_13750 [Janthinobacterium sp.]|jgi:hypothetical protein|nr:hypothetical protein [Janthinobacterium sp.]
MLDFVVGGADFFADDSLVVLDGAIFRTALLHQPVGAAQVLKVWI